MSGGAHFVHSTKAEGNCNFMAISHEKWSGWLAVLEEILHEADVNREFAFGIHIDAAIIAAYAKLGSERVMSGDEAVPSDEA